MFVLKLIQSKRPFSCAIAEEMRNKRECSVTHTGLGAGASRGPQPFTRQLGTEEQDSFKCYDKAKQTFRR